MKIDLFSDMGVPAGSVDVPQEVIDAACLVRHWMANNMVREFHGLRTTPDERGDRIAVDCGRQ
jgi:hypothetical protein